MGNIFALIIAIISGVLFGIIFLLVKPEIKEKMKNKLPLHICNIIGIFMLVIFVSYLICFTTGKHLNSSVNYIEYPIEKMTFDKVYFNDNKKDIIGSWVIIESPNRKYKNVVIVEEETYMIRWLWNVRILNEKYHVYLSKEAYNRLQSGSVT